MPNYLNVKHDLSLLGDEDVYVILYDFACGRFLRKRTTEEAEIIGRSAKVNHIKDWLKAAVRNKTSWLQNVNESGIPKKIAKLSSLDHAFDEANKCMIKENNKIKSHVISTKDEVVYQKLSNDFYIVRLLTPEALDNESRMMQHCIGQGAYDHLLARPDTYMFLSLRDQYNKAHATIEILIEDGGIMTIEQLQGKQNNPPIKKYNEPLMEFLSKPNIICNSVYELFNKIKDENGFWYDFDKLPVGFTHLGNLLFEDNLYEIPKGVHVKGSLEIRNRDGQNVIINDNLHVDGNTKIATSTCRFGDNMIFENDLNLSFLHSASFGNNIHIKGNLMLLSAEITEVGENMQIDGILSIDYSRLKKIPSSIKYNGLHIVKHPIYDDCEIELPNHQLNYSTLNTQCNTHTNFPENMIVKELVLYASHAGDKPNVKNLPQKMTILNFLFLTRIGSEIEGEINKSTVSLKDWSLSGDIILDKSMIQALPDNMNVRSFKMQDTTIFNMPSQLYISQSFDLMNSKIDKFPDKLHLGKNAVILLADTSVTNIPNGSISYDFEGTICIYNQMLDHIPDDLNPNVKIIIIHVNKDKSYSPDEYRALIADKDSEEYKNISQAPKQRHLSVYENFENNFLLKNYK